MLDFNETRRKYRLIVNLCIENLYIYVRGSKTISNSLSVRVSSDYSEPGSKNPLIFSFSHNFM